MKFLARADHLYQTIRVVQSSIPQRSTVPILRSLKVEAEDGELYLTGTDLEVGVKVEFETAEVQESGEIAVPADRFSSLLREFGESDIQITTDGHILVLESSEGQFKIVGHDVSDYPEFPTLDNDMEIALQGQDLTEMVDRTAFAVADEMQMYALTGVYCRMADNQIEMVGSDGSRLARSQKRLQTDIDQEFTVNVPPRVLKIMKKLVDDDEEIYFSGDESKVLFRTSRGKVYARQVEGNYPDYEQVIPNNSEFDVDIDRDQLEGALRKVSILTSRDMPAVGFRFEEGELNLFSRSQEYGEGKMSIPANYSGDTFKIMFNPDYLLDALKVLEEDMVNISFTDSESGGVITEGSHFLYVAMPLDIDEIEDF